ncbi:MAG: hypothetical protein RSC43_04945, partial [Clostridia bacterium]
MRKSFPFLTVAVITVFAVALVLFLVFLNKTASVEGAIPEIPPVESETTTPENIDYSKVTITPQNVQSVVAALSRPSEYYYETSSELFYNSGSTKYFRRKWVKNGWERVDIFNGQAVNMHVIFGNGNAFYWRPGDSDYFKTRAGSFTADESQMMMRYEDVIKLPKKQITDAKLTRYRGSECIYVEAKNAETAYHTRFWISTENGLLLL